MVTQASFRDGDVLAGKYRLERLLGTGGMGVVYAALHLELQQRVAVKLLRQESCDDDQAVARFLVEARATARLRGPHVTRVLDVGRLESNTPFLVMEFLEGINLQQLLTERGPQPIDRAVDFLLEICEALAEAHRAGVVHRDLKPANLFLTRDAYGDPSIKVMDFGISKILEPTAPGDIGLTDSRTMVGSPVYMSPEQMRSARDVDHRTDIWSLGTVLFELVTGRPVWNGPSLSDVCAQVARDPTPDLAEVRPGVVPELSSVVARCLQKDPDRRYQQVADLALALARFGSPRGQMTLVRVLQLAGHSSSQALQTTGGVTPQAGQRSTESTLEGTAAARSTTSSRRSFRPIVATLVVLSIGTITAFWIYRRPLPAPPLSSLSTAAVVTAPRLTSGVASAPSASAAPMVVPTMRLPEPSQGQASPDGANTKHRASRKPDPETNRPKPVATAENGATVDPMSIRK